MSMDAYTRSYFKLMEASQPLPVYYQCECGSRLKYGSRAREKFKAHFGTVKHQAWIHASMVPPVPPGQ